MRIDKYLKVSRLIKRRTVASQACTAGRIKINDQVAKPGSVVKEGDIIEIGLGEKKIQVKVASIKEHVRKEEAELMYTVCQ